MSVYCSNFYGSIQCRNFATRFGDRCGFCKVHERGRPIKEGKLPNAPTAWEPCSPTIEEEEDEDDKTTSGSTLPKCLEDALCKGSTHLTEEESLLDATDTGHHCRGFPDTSPPVAPSRLVHSIFSSHLNIPDRLFCLSSSSLTSIPNFCRIHQILRRHHSDSMLRRKSSRRRSGLSRSQSSTSFRSAVSRLEHIDPVVAQRDALIAAQLCYNPGMGSEIPEEERPSWDGHGLPRDDSNIHRPGDYDLRRRQSIRLINNDLGPRSSLDPHSRRSIDPIHRQSMDRCRRKSGTNRTMERASFDHSSLQRCPSARSSFDHGSSWRHRLPRGDEHRPSSRASSRQRPPSVSDYNASFLHSMHSAREYDRFDDERASMMSVSRHLRKSRSMLVPLPNHEPARAAKPTSSYYFTSRTPDQNKRQSFSTSKMQRDHSSRPSSTLSQSLRTPKSMSFLKTRNIKQQEKRQHHSDLAVQLAREKYREQVQKQEALKAQSSIGFHTTRQPSHTSSGFRKSLRNTSNASTGVSLAVSASHTLHPSQDASIRKTVRKVSNGLKTKLRNLFRRAKDEHDSASLQRSSPGLKQEQNPPTQSVSKPDDEDDYMNVVDPEPEKCSIARVMSRIPSLHAVPSSSKLRSRQGSMESIRSEQAHNSLDDKSRVTSWTNSAISIISNDKAHQRLSIIRETALPPTNTIYSESTYSHDKSPSVHFGGNVATEAPIYSPATFTSQLILPFRAAKTCETGSNIHGAKATATITPSVSLNRIVSAASSVEWKTQLASHVSKRESSTNEAMDGSKFGFKLTVPSMPNPFGHVRERADIVEGEPMSSSDSVHSSRTMTGPSNKGVLSDTVGQTTQLGSPVARGSNAAACPRLSQLMAGEDECQPNHAGEEKAKMGGSQRMVDMFLSSRRRQITGSDETGAFL
ncbi:hypothetical protein EV126DRAFT_457470 [Verticillium dahliae]|nr:hypothetical protein EV126DRAFT_457470 [Verticillium dahliae]